MAEYQKFHTKSCTLCIGIYHFFVPLLVIKINLMLSAIRNPQSAIRNPQSAIRNPQSAIRNSYKLTAFFFIAFFISGFSAFSQTTAIPDDKFEQALIDLGIDTNGKNNTILNSDAVAVNSLNIVGKGIADLSGIEAFTSLTYLSCWLNQLTSLDVSSNTALTDLNCEGNQLTSLNVSSNVALTDLNCSNNELTSLNISANTALTDLNCSNNELTSLNISANTALTDLNCTSNELTSLDISSNTALTRLTCGNNSLTSLDVSSNTALTQLTCGNNSLTSLDVSANKKLTRLACTNGQLTSLNLKNGNNTSLSLNAANNPNLSCIQVDNPSNIPSSWTKDATAVYSEDCTPQVPELTTTTASAITSTTATLNGDLTSIGLAAITEGGFVYAISNEDLIIDAAGVAKEVVNGVATGDFEKDITGLTAGTTYFYRAYATNSAGTSYGGEQSFTTLAAAPTASTTAASAITSTTATLNGNITSDGGAAITARGFVYAISNADLTIGVTDVTDVTVSGTEIGTFNSAITSLTAGTKYYYRAYATNSFGTTYGEVQSFTTLAAPTAPTTSTAAASTITSTTATLNGDITSDGGATITARGFVYAISNADLTIGIAGVTDVVVSGTTGVFEKDITGLTAGTKYYYRAYATNSVGTTYGGEQSFTTLAVAPTAPTTSTAAASAITSTTATLNGNITSDGGATITARGFVYAISNADLTIGATGVTDVAVSGTTGTFNSAITSLTAGTKYYYRAYATNSVDTSYGGEQSFTTEAVLSIEDFEQSAVAISPNPATGIVNITVSEKTGYKLLDTGGHLLQQGTFATGAHSIDMSPLAEGIYLFILNTGKESFTRRIIRN